MKRIIIFFKYLLLPFILQHLRQILAVWGLILLFLWIGNRQAWFRLPFQSLSAFDALTESTALIIQTPDTEQQLEVLKTLPYYKELSSLSLLQDWVQELTWIKDFLKQQQEMATWTYQILSAPQVVSNTDVAWLYVVELSEAAPTVLSLLDQASDGQVVEQHIYRNNTIYQLKFEQGDWALAVVGNLLLWSPATVLVESAVEQLDNIDAATTRNASFNALDLGDLQEDSNLRIYTNFKSIATLTSVLSVPNTRLLLSLMDLGEWTGFQTQWLETGFLWSGRFQPEPDHAFLKALAKQPAPSDTKLLEYLPKNLGAMLYLGWQDFNQLYQAYQQTANEDFENYFLPWIGQDLALFIKDPTNEEDAFEKDKLVFVAAKDMGAAQAALERYAHDFGELERSTYQNFELVRLAAQFPLKAILGEELQALQNPYYTTVGDYVVFANARVTLEGWIKSFNAGQLLSQLPAYQAPLAQLKNQSNAYALLSTPNAAKFLHYLGRPALHDYLTASLEQFRNLYPIGVQLHGLGRQFQISISARLNSIVETEENLATAAWEVDLATEAAIAPQALRSHDGDYYVLIQDTEHRLYFYNKNGENIWPANTVLNHTINSEIFEVDFYGNDQTQYAFSTEEAIYVMNKEGQTLKVIRLISRASNGLLVVDQGEGPRFFIACKNGHAYAYEQNGRPLSGWQPLQKVGMIHYPMTYFEENGKDYFVMLNRWGRYQGFNRRGEAYFRQGRAGGNISGWGIDPNLGRLAVGHQNGTVRVLNSRAKGFKIGVVPELKKAVQFVYADVVGDARKDYVRVGLEHLAVHYYNKEKNAKGKLKDKLVAAGVYTIPKANKQAFEVKIPGRKKSYIGWLEPEQGSISLVDATGKLQNGFPMAGTSKFSVVDLFGEGGETLIVANRDKVYTYKLTL